MKKYIILGMFLISCVVNLFASSDQAVVKLPDRYEVKLGRVLYAPTGRDTGSVTNHQHGEQGNSTVVLSADTESSLGTPHVSGHGLDAMNVSLYGSEVSGEVMNPVADARGTVSTVGLFEVSDNLKQEDLFFDYGNKKIKYYNKELKRLHDKLAALSSQKLTPAVYKLRKEALQESISFYNNGIMQEKNSAANLTMEDVMSFLGDRANLSSPETQPCYFQSMKMVADEFNYNMKCRLRRAKK